MSKMILTKNRINTLAIKIVDMYQHEYKDFEGSPEPLSLIYVEEAMQASMIKDKEWFHLDALSDIQLNKIWTKVASIAQARNSFSNKRISYIRGLRSLIAKTGGSFWE